jgi:hypothetical protein
MLGCIFYHEKAYKFVGLLAAARRRKNKED